MRFRLRRLKIGGGVESLCSGSARFAQQCDPIAFLLGPQHLTGDQDAVVGPRERLRLESAADGLLGDRISAASALIRRARGKPDAINAT
jgi:hypothetical protein